MVGSNKVKFIKEDLDIHNFDYLGNSKKDLPIWKYCRKIIYTNASSDLIKIIKSMKLKHTQVPTIFEN